MSKKRILIVDDEKGFTAMLSLNLEATGKYEVKIENNSTNAITTALHYNPDIVLLDIVMPNLEGPDIAIRMREDRNLKNTPVVFLTATIRPSEAKAMGGRIGGHPFVAKPSNLSVLLASIESNIFLHN